MTQLNFTLQTLTPIFIGSGEELRKDFDFAVHDGGTYRLNSDVILEKKYRPNGSFVPGRLLDKDDFRKREFFRYLVRGTPRSEKTDARLMACIKDVYECPYIPGSSIKGAIRTALAKAEIRDRKLKLYPSIDLTSSSRSSLKSKDDLIERELFGLGAASEASKFPRVDIFRALQVSDAMMATERRRPGGGLFIANATPISRSLSATGTSVQIELEAVRKMQRFTGTLTFDDFLLNGKFSDRAEIFENWIDTMRDAGYERLKWLIDWFKGVDSSDMIDKSLKDMLELKAYEIPHALIQIGGGTGWDGMTYGKLLQDKDPTQFEIMIEELKILRPTCGGFPRRTEKQLFPSSKKVVLDPKTGWKPASLLGWCLLVFEKKAGSK